ncbi:hypothetical protein V5F53_03410 [Xanthobacter sp. V4C-4]|uniref:hypothetical protein n=1 Tax=Xanthobacter cornucopiae TaxID=3119924 RepID=UPI00372BA8EB
MLLHYIIALGLAGFAILMGIILGDYGPWYLSWFLGTGFMVLVAVSAGVLFEAQDDAARAASAGEGEGAGDVAGVVTAGAPAHRASGGTHGKA